jgi:hypothetical protein
MLSQVPDMQTGFEFRRDMYEHMGLTLPEVPANKVLFWLRTPPLYRSLLNPDEVLKIVNYYNMSYTYGRVVAAAICVTLAVFCVMAVCSVPVLVILMHARISVARHAMHFSYCLSHQ